MNHKKHTHLDQKHSNQNAIDHHDIDQDASQMGLGTAAAKHFQSVATDLDLPTRDSTPRAADLDEASST